MRCAACKSVFYCSRACQEKHWSVHKIGCCLKAAIKQITLPNEPKFLLVSGLMFDSEDCFFTKALKPVLESQTISLESINFSPKTFLSKLRSGRFSTCVVFQLGSGGQDKSFFTDEIRMYITAWVKAGGKLIITGEGRVLTVFNKWFGKTWAFEGDWYRRTQHVLNRTAFNAIPELLSTTSSSFLLPIKCNAKACMLSNVHPTERLYSPESGAVSVSLVPGFGGGEIDSQFCLVAAAAFGHGRVSFIGDVNAEVTTCQIILSLGSVDKQYERNCKWLRRRHFVLLLSACKFLSAAEMPKIEVIGDVTPVGNSAIMKVFSDFYLCNLIAGYL